MHQALRIFRKDCRHFLPEIVLTLALGVAFLWLSRFFWQFQFDAQATQHLPLDLDRLQKLAQLVAILWPISWLIVIARVVQDENLIGNRQFWVTRPYLWQKLLASKLLFITIFILLPFLAVQMLILVRAGFNPLHYLPGLLFLLVLITGAFVLPFLCLSVVTSSLLRIIGTLLVIGVVVAAVAFFSRTGYPSPQSVYLPNSDRFTIPLIFVGSALVVLVQYSTRRAWLARSVLVAMPLFEIAFGVTANSQVLLPPYYPELSASETSPINFTLDSLAGDNGGAYDREDKFVSMRIPLKISSIQFGHIVQANNIRIAIDSPELHWTSSWQGTLMETFDSASSATSLNVSVDRKVFEQIASKVASLRVELALTELEDGDPIRITYPPTGPIALPTIGRCPNVDRDTDHLTCFSPLHAPAINRVIAELCQRDGGQVNGNAVSDLIGSLDPDPAELSLLPVSVEDIRFSSFPGRQAGFYKICPGAHIVITPMHLLRRFRYSFTARDVTFPKAYPDGIQLFQKNIVP